MSCFRYRVSYFIRIGWMVAAIVLGSCSRSGIGYNQGYSPSQPIAFDHSLHAGELAMNCRYCHTNVTRSNQATVPSLNICMNCHLSVRGKGGKDSPEVNKLIKASMTEKPVKWVRVHMLPDFVRFNHKRHVLKGVACQSCHGQIQTMKKVKQQAELSMGWCLECHRKPEIKGSLNCTTCHH